MGILEEVTKMKKEGRNEEEIANELKQRGISPKEIDDSLNQSRIKNAVSDENGNNFSAPSSSRTSTAYRPSIKEIQENGGEYPSYEENYEQGNSQVPEYEPENQEDYPQNGQGNQEYPPSEAGYGQESSGYYPQEEGNYSQEYSEYYPQEGYSPSYSSSNTDTIIEVSEQVFSDKIKKIKKQLDEFSEFKVIFQTKVENALERLKKIENIIDRLQSAVLEKVGSYGENLSNMKREMNMMQDSFRKVIGEDSTQKKEYKDANSRTKKKVSSKKKISHKKK